MPREEWKHETVSALHLASEANYHSITGNYSVYVFIKMGRVYSYVYLRIKKHYTM